MPYNREKDKRLQPSLPQESQDITTDKPFFTDFQCISIAKSLAVDSHHTDITLFYQVMLALIPDH